jgi:GAF domain-containing protein
MDEEHSDIKIPVSRLMALCKIGQTINSILDLDKLLETVMDLMIQEVKAERGLILLKDDITQEFQVRVARNLDKSTIENAAEYSKNIVQKAGKGQIIFTHDASSDESFKDFSSVILFNIRSLMCVRSLLRIKSSGLFMWIEEQPGINFAMTILIFFRYLQIMLPSLSKMPDYTN